MLILKEKLENARKKERQLYDTFFGPLVIIVTIHTGVKKIKQSYIEIILIEAV